MVALYRRRKPLPPVQLARAWGGLPSPPRTFCDPSRLSGCIPRERRVRGVIAVSVIKVTFVLVLLRSAAQATKGEKEMKLHQSSLIMLMIAVVAIVLVFTEVDHDDGGHITNLTATDDGSSLTIQSSTGNDVAIRCAGFGGAGGRVGFLCPGQLAELERLIELHPTPTP